MFSEPDSIYSTNRGRAKSNAFEQAAGSNSLSPGFYPLDLFGCVWRRFAVAGNLASQPGDFFDDIAGGGKSVPHQMAAHHGSGPANATPAMDEQRFVFGNRVINLIKDLSQDFRIGNAAVAQRYAHNVDVQFSRLGEDLQTIRIWGGLTFLGQIQKRQDSCIQKSG
jgi:hypothetical protein